LLGNGVQQLVAASPDDDSQAHGVDACNKANSATFDELFVSHYGVIVRLLGRLVGDCGQAEDLANETFLKLYRRPDLQRSHGNVGGWLYRTAMNLGIDALRAASRRTRYEAAAARASSHVQSNQNSLHELLRAEKQQRVRAVLGALKPVHAQALLPRVCGYSYKELAESLAMDAGSVGTLLIRAEAEFEKRYLEKFGPEEEL
jgi:RNA polymerase sigma-70 factor, ECF subfamily